MYESLNTNPILSINLNNGIYALGSDSGNGKTYLALVMTKFREAGLPVISFSYTDYHKGTNLATLLEEYPKVIMLDRYDMYYNEEFDKLICKNKNNSIILVDCKHWNHLFQEDVELAEVYLEEDKIEVS